MRKWINTISEAPISDFSYEEEEEASSFKDTDKKLMKSPKGREKILRAFRKTPHNFIVHILVHGGWDAEDYGVHADVDSYLATYAGIYQSVEVMGREYESEPGCIRVVMVGNLSPEGFMPMTAWTLAHKIGHGLQDVATPGYSKMADDVGDLIAHQLYSITYPHEGPVERGDSGVGTRFSEDVVPHQYLTMKSARTDNLSTTFEVFPELVAQYLITGKVAFNREAIYADYPGDKKLVDFRVDVAEREINKALFGLFHALEGSIIVEL